MVVVLDDDAAAAARTGEFTQLIKRVGNENREDDYFFWRETLWWVVHAGADRVGHVLGAAAALKRSLT